MAKSANNMKEYRAKMSEANRISIKEKDIIRKTAAIKKMREYRKKKNKE